MGISTVASYRCSQLFEAVGLSKAVVEMCFRGVSSRIQGADFADIQQDQFNLARQAWLARKALTQGGLLKFVHGGEYHTYNPDVVQTLQVAVRSGNYADYKEYARLVNERPVATLRDLLTLKKVDNPVALEQVEPAAKLFPASTPPPCPSARWARKPTKRWRWP